MLSKACASSVLVQTDHPWRYTAAGTQSSQCETSIFEEREWPRAQTSASTKSGMSMLKLDAKGGGGQIWC